MRKLPLLVSLILCLLAQWGSADTSTLPWKLLRAIPRASGHFTQGLVYADKQLFESTGRYGQSQLIAYDADTLAIQKTVQLRPDVFGEGLTVINNELYQLSWKSGEIFVYDTSLNPVRVLHIPGESWGLTTDGQSLIMSDGSGVLQIFNPADGKRLRTMTVTDISGQHWNDINELEWVDGKIFANLWHRNTVLVIDGKTGQVTGQYDFGKLSEATSLQLPGRDSEQVLNGMAWNPLTHTLLVTGKDWPVWYELEITLH